MLNSLKEKLRQKAIDNYSSMFSGDAVEEAKLRELTMRLLNDIIQHDHISLGESEKRSILDDVIMEFIGYGAIDHLMKDPSITEIMINGTDTVYIERKGKKQLLEGMFPDEKQLYHLVYKLVAPTRRRVDEMTPYTDLTLKDGSRVNIIIPPLALDGPVITVRKFSREINTIEDLIRLGTMNKIMADFLISAVRARLNIVFSGATGVGKTTTLNVLSSYISPEERIITIEDTAELRLSQRHVVRLETRPPSVEGRGEVRIRDLFRNSLRMRPERIILGEVRGEETLDMLQAICSGHSGSLAVVHANSPEDLIYRLETMILTSGIALNIPAIQRQIGAAINLIVQQEQLLDGTRKVTHIAQLAGLRNDFVIVEDLFTFKMEEFDSAGRIKGDWVYSGAKPCFKAQYEKMAVPFPLGLDSFK